MAWFVVASILVLASPSFGLRYISDNDYSSFPPLNYFDPFESCLMQDGGVFCVAKAELFSEEPNELLAKMTNFSSLIRHFNYSKIQYGYCITKRCKKYYKGNSTSELQETTEACLSDHMTRHYGLKARILNLKCYHQGEETQLDIRDYFMGAVVVLIVGLAVIGTLQDVCGSDKKTGFLSCFSLRANWRIFKDPWPSDTKSERLIGINALRVITSMLVVLTHSFMPIFIAIANPVEIEKVFESWDSQPVLHLNWVMQTFFFLSGMFLVYSLKSSAKRTPLTWRSLPKAILFRWLRLIPLCLVMLLFSVSWFRHKAKGPGWQQAVEYESRSCENNWLYFVLGINNYRDNVDCLVQTWSNACDFQLHIVGLSIILLSPTKRIRNIGLWVFFVVGIFFPLYETLTKDLYGIAVVLPESVRDSTEFVKDATFRNLYIRTHTNIPSFVIGIAFGYKLVDWLEKGITEEDSKKYRKYSLLYWCLFPAMLGAMGLTGIFFVHDYPMPMVIRAAFALFQKPVWAILVALIIFGQVFRIEKVPLYRGILESHFWVPLAKLTFCLYNVHVTVIRFVCGDSTTLKFFSNLQAINAYFGFLVCSYIVALLMWLLVETPINNLIRLYFPEKAKTIESNSTIEKGTKSE